jgi:hypothetical protein
VPAAAVIPAPIAYIKIAAVKASVVGFRPFEVDAAASCKFSCAISFGLGQNWGNLVLSRYFEQIGVLQPGFSLNSSAWNNKIGLWFFLLVT